MDLRYSRVTSAGVVSIFSGSGKRGYKEGPATVAQFNAPQGVAYDAARNVVYVADTGNHVIRKITADGTTSLFAGTAPSNKSGNEDDHGTKTTFDAPAGLALDASGTLWIADDLDKSVLRIKDAATRLQNQLQGTPEEASPADGTGGAEGKSKKKKLKPGAGSNKLIDTAST